MTGIIMKVVYDSGTITIRIEDHDKQRQVSIRTSIEEASDAHDGRNFDLSKVINSIDWKDKP